jgi:hypothetical protein
MVLSQRADSFVKGIHLDQYCLQLDSFERNPMKSLVFSLVVTLVSSATYANPQSEKLKSTVQSLSACGNFIRFDNEYVYTGFGNYWTSPSQPRLPQASSMTFVSIDQGIENHIETLDSVVDVLKIESSTFVLTYSGIEEWDLAEPKRLATYNTNSFTRPYKDEEHPRAFARYKNKLVIAHGRLGISIFDLTTKKVTRTMAVAQSHQPLESMVNGISVSGRYAIAVADSYSLVGPNEKPAFQGLIVVDLETETVVSELNGLEPADSVLSDGKVAIVSLYGQPLKKYSVAALAKATKLPSPTHRLWKFPVEGRQFGKASMDDRYYYTCFSKMPELGEGPFYKKMPLVFDRRVLLLD